MRCEKCGLENPEKNSFCSHCGTPLSLQGATIAATADIDDKAAAPQPQSAPLAPEERLWESYPSLWTSAPPLIVILVVYLVAALALWGNGAGQWVAFGVAAGLALLLFLRYLVLLRSIHYRLTTQRFFIERGIFSRRTDELELEKYKDVFVSQDFLDRLVACGDVEIVTGDLTSPQIRIVDVRDPVGVKETIRQAARARQAALGMIRREEV